MLNKYTSFVVIAMILALVVSVLLTVGYIYFIDKKKTAETTKSIVTTPTTWAWEKGEDLGKGYAKYAFAPVAAIVSAPVAGIYFVGDSIVNVFRKGEDFSMNQGDTIQVQLIKPLDMPVL